MTSVQKVTVIRWIIAVCQRALQEMLFFLREILYIVIFKDLFLEPENKTSVVTKT